MCCLKYPNYRQETANIIKISSQTKAKTDNLFPNDRRIPCVLKKKQTRKVYYSRDRRRQWWRRPGAPGADVGQERSLVTQEIRWTDKRNKVTATKASWPLLEGSGVYQFHMLSIGLAIVNRTGKNNKRIFVLYCKQICFINSGRLYFSFLISPLTLL